MYETVSVDEAIARGKRILNYPIAIIQLTIILTCIGLMSFYNPPNWVLLTGALSTFVIPWIYWSFMITKWRIWAFENVRNVHELKQLAIKEKLIWPDGSVFEKTEIRTSAEKEKLNALQSKFKENDVFIDDDIKLN